MLLFKAVYPLDVESKLALLHTTKGCVLKDNYNCLVWYSERDMAPWWTGGHVHDGMNSPKSQKTLVGVFCSAKLISSSANMMKSQFNDAKPCCGIIPSRFGLSPARADQDNYEKIIVIPVEERVRQLMQLDHLNPQRNHETALVTSTSEEVRMSLVIKKRELPRLLAILKISASITSLNALYQLDWKMTPQLDAAAAREMMNKTTVKLMLRDNFVCCAVNENDTENDTENENEKGVMAERRDVLEVNVLRQRYSSRNTTTIFSHDEVVAWKCQAAPLERAKKSMGLLKNGESTMREMKKMNENVMSNENDTEKEKEKEKKTKKCIVEMCLDWVREVIQLCLCLLVSIYVLTKDGEDSMTSSPPCGFVNGVGAKSERSLKDGKIQSTRRIHQSYSFMNSRLVALIMCMSMLSSSVEAQPSCGNGDGASSDKGLFAIFDRTTKRIGNGCYYSIIALLTMMRKSTLFRRAPVLILAALMSRVAVVSAACAVTPDGNGHVSIAAGTTSIANSAFNGCSTLKSVYCK